MRDLPSFHRRDSSLGKLPVKESEEAISKELLSAKSSPDEAELAIAIAKPGDFSETVHRSSKRPASTSPSLSPPREAGRPLGVSLFKPQTKRSTTSKNEPNASETHHPSKQQETGSSRNRDKQEPSIIGGGPDVIPQTLGESHTMPDALGQESTQTKSPSRQDSFRSLVTQDLAISNHTHPQVPSVSFALPSKSVESSSKAKKLAHQFSFSGDEDQSNNLSRSTSNSRRSNDKLLEILTSTGDFWPEKPIDKLGAVLHPPRVLPDTLKIDYLSNFFQIDNIIEHYTSNSRGDRDDVYKNHGIEFNQCGIIPAYNRPVRNAAEYAHFAEWFLQHHEELGAQKVVFQRAQESARVAFFHRKANILLILAYRGGKEKISDDFITLFRPGLQIIDCRKPFLSFAGLGDSEFGKLLRLPKPIS